MILPHDCKHQGQDELHGKGMRVWNSTKEGRRCTVCGTHVKDALVRVRTVERKKGQ